MRLNGLNVWNSRVKNAKGAKVEKTVGVDNEATCRRR